jgi:hypothetical protein
MYQSKRVAKVVVYIWLSSWLLAEKSHLDLSQSEKKITVAKVDQIQKMTTGFTQNDNFWPFWVKIIVILWIWSALTTVIFFSTWDKSRDLLANSQLLEQM